MSTNRTPRTDKELEQEVLRFKRHQIVNHQCLSPGKARRHSASGCAVLSFYSLVVAVLATCSLSAIISMTAADHNQIVISDAPAIVPLLDYGDPVPDVPHYSICAKAWGVSDELAASIRTVSAATGVADTLLLAVGQVESGNDHYRDYGVVRGDGGLAVGWGQVHRKPWQAYFSKQVGYQFDLDCLLDNVTLAALILLRGGYDPSDPATIGPACSYYNTGQRGLKSTRYSRAVLSVLAEIEGETS